MLNREMKSHKKDDLQKTTYIIQKLIGKLLGHSDIWILANLNKKYGLDYKDIEKVFRHCIERGNRNISYIEKVAIAYAEKGEEALALTNSKALNEINKNKISRRKSLNDKKTSKATMPYLPFEEKLTEQEIIESKKLINIELRVQVKNEVEKKAMINALENNFTIHEVGNIFEHIEGNRIIKFFNVFVSLKTQ